MKKIFFCIILIFISSTAAFAFDDLSTTIDSINTQFIKDLIVSNVQGHSKLTLIQDSDYNLIFEYANTDNIMAMALLGRGVIRVTFNINKLNATQTEVVAREVFVSNPGAMNEMTVASSNKKDKQWLEDLLSVVKNATEMKDEQDKSDAEALSNKPATPITGFRGLVWGDTLIKLGRRTIASADTPFSSYTRDNDKLTLGNIELKSVVYNFLENKLTSIKIEISDEYTKIREVLIGHYGKPNKINHTTGDCDWHDENGTVVLIRESAYSSTIKIISANEDILLKKFNNNIADVASKDF